jgi:116 kDa U5 small nuclear ribonucleoprotein component
MTKLDKEGPLIIHITKLYNKFDEPNEFYSFGRILSGIIFFFLTCSGTLKLNQKVKILGEFYSINNEEDMNISIVNNISILQSRYKIDINFAIAGNLILIDGNFKN